MEMIAQLAERNFLGRDTSFLKLVAARYLGAMVAGDLS